MSTLSDPILQTVRIPNMNFRGNKFVNEDGTLTDVAQGFFDLLNTALNNIVGNEGLVAPSQNNTNIVTIANNNVISQTGNVVYTCKPGTLIWNTDNTQLIVAFPGTPPVFKQILTA